MKKIYLILILVLVLSSSGVGFFIWRKKQKKAEENEQLPESTQEKSTESIKSDIPKAFITDISIDYVDTGKRELGYSMHYKGLSHKGTFKDGDKNTFVVQSFGSFAVFQSNRIQEEQGTDTKSVVAVSAEDFYQDSFVYLAIYNKKQLVTGLKVNLHTGEQIEGLPTKWAQLED